VKTETGVGDGRGPTININTFKKCSVTIEEIPETPTRSNAYHDTLDEELESNSNSPLSPVDSVPSVPPIADTKSRDGYDPHYDLTTESSVCQEHASRNVHSNEPLFMRRNQVSSETD